MPGAFKKGVNVTGVGLSLLINCSAMIPKSKVSKVSLSHSKLARFTGWRSEISVHQTIADLLSKRGTFWSKGK